MSHLKISNKRLIKMCLFIYIFVVVVSLCLYFLYTKGFNNVDSKSLILLLFIDSLCIILIFRTKYFEFDSSGEVISVRSYHPFVRRERRSEFPKQMLNHYQLKKSPYCTAYLKFFLESSENRKIIIRYKISACNQTAFLQIKKSLDCLSKND